MKKLFYKMLVKYFEKQIQKEDQIFLSQNYFSIISLLKSTMERLKEGE